MLPFVSEIGGAMINWHTFPKSVKPIEEIQDAISVFEAEDSRITSAQHQLDSNGVLAVVRPGLQSLGFVIETGKSRDEKIQIPVLFGLNGKTERTFEADGFHSGAGIVLEVEAGRAVTNYQFLKDLFQACMMQNTHHLMIAVRNNYRGSDDFKKVVSFFETLYASGRLTLPLASITIIGY
jgi:hypothetical protein